MQKTKNKTALVWFTNDLRLKDNNVLDCALKNHQQVIAVYCFNPDHYKLSPFGFKKTEKYRAKFLIESINDLKRNLNKIDIPLFVYNEYPEKIIPELVSQYFCSDVYVQKEWTSEEINTLNKTKQADPSDITFHEIYNQFLYHPEDVAKHFNEIPEVFTNFRKGLETKCNVRPTKPNLYHNENQIILNNTYIPSLSDLGFEPFETHHNTAFPFKGGETEAFARLNNYFFETKKLGVYKKTRNGLIGIDYSSKFSPWLANGCISAKTIFWQIKAFENEHFKNDSTYWLIFELIWRDFFKYISLKHSNQIFKIDGILNIHYEWKRTTSLIQNWINGNTSEPFVNANMIELKKTGWMSNRGRQNVASYFSKHLKLDWRIGASYFESLLLDYDVHSNYGNWMYVSGVGNDPRNREFNVKLQAERYDSNHKYQTLWLQNSLFE
jgi:deoxyribodipyrimidine photo-lyase